MHRLTLLVHERGKAEDRIRRARVSHHGAHRDHGIEPVSELAWEALGHKVAGEPLTPILRVGAELHRADADDPSIQPRVAHIGHTCADQSRHWMFDLDMINPRAVRRVPLKRHPAFHCARLEFFIAADYLEAAIGIFPNWQSETPIALLADHPVVHVVQPIGLALFAKRRHPVDLLVHPHHVVAQGVHADVPLVHHAVQQRRATTPAVRISVHILVTAIHIAFGTQQLLNQIGHIMPIFPGEGAKAVHIVAVFVERRDKGRAVGFAQLVVFWTAAWRVVHNPGAFGLADFVP